MVPRRRPPPQQLLLFNIWFEELPSSDSTTFFPPLQPRYQTIITPASWAFAIWGVIFPAELAFVVVQCLPSARDSELVTSGVAWGWVRGQPKVSI